jgi:hypothetical protein
MCAAIPREITPGRRLIAAKTLRPTLRIHAPFSQQLSRPRLPDPPRLIQLQGAFVNEKLD